MATVKVTLLETEKKNVVVIEYSKPKQEVKKEDGFFGLAVKASTDGTTGFFEKRYPKGKLTIEQAKGIAQGAFFMVGVISVCLFDETGKVWFYIKMNEDGTVYREELYP